MGAGAKSLILLLGLCLALPMALGTPAPAHASVLADIDGHWAEQDILLLTARGAVHGFPDGTFRPEVAVTRAQFTAMLVTAAAVPLPPTGVPPVFDDVARDHWAFQPIIAAWEAGLVPPDGDTRFEPDALINPSELAAFLDRLIAWRLPPAAAAAGAPKFNDGTFPPPAQVNRGQAAAQLARALRYLGLDYDVVGTLRYRPGTEAHLALINAADGTELKVPLGAQTIYLRNGRRAHRDDLQADDETIIVMQGGRAALVQGWHLETAGTVVEVFPAAMELALRDDGGVWRVASLAPQATVVRNDRPADLAALRPGDHLTAVVSVLGGSIRSLRAMSVYAFGQIQSLNFNQRTLRVRGVLDATAAVWWHPAVAVSLDGAHSRPEYLRPGDTVYVAVNEDGRVVHLQAYRQNPGPGDREVPYDQRRS